LDLKISQQGLNKKQFTKETEVSFVAAVASRARPEAFRQKVTCRPAEEHLVGPRPTSISVYTAPTKADISNTALWKLMVR
jgi:hypothetical protein